MMRKRGKESGRNWISMNNSDRSGGRCRDRYLWQMGGKAFKGQDLPRLCSLLLEHVGQAVVEGSQVAVVVLDSPAEDGLVAGRHQGHHSLVADGGVLALVLRVDDQEQVLDLPAQVAEHTAVELTERVQGPGLLVVGQVLDGLGSRWSGQR